MDEANTKNHWIEALTASIIDQNPYLRNFARSEVFPKVHSEDPEWQKMHLKLTSEVRTLAEEFGDILPNLLAYNSEDDADQIFDMEVKAMEYYIGLYQLQVLEGLAACGAEMHNGYKYV